MVFRWNYLFHEVFLVFYDKKFTPKKSIDLIQLNSKWNELRHNSLKPNTQVSFCKKKPTRVLYQNTWNIRLLVDDSFVPSSKQPSKIYCRLTHFNTQVSFCKNSPSEYFIRRTLMVTWGVICLLRFLPREQIYGGHYS